MLCYPIPNSSVSSQLMLAVETIASANSSTFPARCDKFSVLAECPYKTIMWFSCSNPY